MRTLLLLVFLAGCGIAGAVGSTPDMAVPRDPTLCRTKADLGHEVWWIFVPDKGISLLQDGPILTRGGYYGSRYVCKDHGKEHNGLWWEQVPPDNREIP